MPVIAKTNMRVASPVTVTETVLNGTDSFVYDETRRALLTFRNATGGALSPIIDGAGAGTAHFPGAGSKDLTGGFAVGSIPAGGVRDVDLNEIKHYLVGAIAITGGTGLVAILREF